MQGELAHHQQLAVDVREVGVHLAFRVVEDPEFGDFGREPPGVVFRVGIFNTHQHTKTVLDGAHRLSIDANFRFADPLNHRAHAAK